MRFDAFLVMQVNRTGFKFTLYEEDAPAPGHRVETLTIASYLRITVFYFSYTCVLQ